MKGLGSKHLQVVATRRMILRPPIAWAPAMYEDSAFDTHPLSLQYVETSCVRATESCNEHIVETLSVSAPGAQPGPWKRQFLQHVLSAQLTSSSCHWSHFGSRYKLESDVRSQPPFTKRPR